MFLYIKVWNKGIISVTEIKNSPIIITGTSPYFKAENNKPSASFAEVNRVTLPSAHYGIIDSAGVTDYINDADIARYNKVQRNFAEKMAQKLGTSVDNVMALMPKIQTGDAKSMIGSGFMGKFESNINCIEINPVREIANLFGGDEAKVMHECFHALNFNLVKAYVARLSNEERGQEISNIILNKMAQGEQMPIFKSESVENINGQLVGKLEFMKPPPLSPNERQALINTINSLTNEHLELVDNKVKLTGEDQKFVRETLFPQLTQSLEIHKHTPEKMEENIMDYIHSYFYRMSVLNSCILRASNPDEIAKLKTIPMTQEMENEGKLALSNLLSTWEGNSAKEQFPAEIIDKAAKAYFMSQEERDARLIENNYRLSKINQKIETIRTQGLSPAKEVIEEQKIIQNNLTYLGHIDELDSIEKQIMASENDPKKIIELNEIKARARKLAEEGTLEKLPEEIQRQFGKCKTQEEILSLLETLTAEHKKIFIEANNKVLEALRLTPQINELDKPVNFLTDTPEHQLLKSQFEEIMEKIKKLGPKTDLKGMPISFFASVEEYNRIEEKGMAVFVKWASKLAKGIK